MSTETNDLIENWETDMSISEEEECTSENKGKL